MEFKGDLMSKTQTRTIFAFFLFTILFALLSACGGSDKDSDSSGSSDKEGPASAPTATEPTDPISGASYDLAIVCNEAKEVVSITGEGLEPDPQTHTCKASGEEDFSLSLKQGVHFPSPNNLTISSKDQDGNAADKTTMIDVPIDTRTSAPTATGPEEAVFGASYDLAIVCNEAGEVVSIMGEGLEPNPQTHTCTGSGAEDFSLNLKQNVSLPSPNNLTLSSTDQDGNPKNKTTMVDVPIDTRTSAPTATGPEEAVFGASYDLAIVCNEAGEVVSIMGEGLEPNPQTHTCTGSGAEDFSLNLKQNVSLPSPNNLTLSSTDQDGNPKDKTTMVDVPIDTLPWRVSIDAESLENISSSNVRSFTIEGTCTEDGQPVMVSVGGVSPETDPDCASNSWSVDIDVTSLNKTTGAISITADHSSSDGDNATQASKEVTNNFICPANFVGVPSLTDYTTNSFCVMKYEAKNDGSGNAISQAGSTPWRSITRNGSITECTDLGAKYDLITNDEWQSIARNIERVKSNWKNGTVGDSGGLSTGHSDSSPAVYLPADSDDNNACHQTGQTCNSSDWDSQRRTHTLSNGEVVWDLAGNVAEWVKDNNMVSYISSAIIMSLLNDATHSTSGSLSGGTTTTSRTAKGHFGPHGDYTGLYSNPWGGIGHGSLNLNLGGGGVGVTRGGYYSTIAPGVFTVVAGFTEMDTASNRAGFRCVYRP